MHHNEYEYLRRAIGDLARRVHDLEDAYNTSPLRARDPETGLNLVDRLEHLEELVDLLVDTEAEEFEEEDELLAEAIAAARAAGNEDGYDCDFIEGYLARAHEED